jgi:hypothetical protein
MKIGVLTLLAISAWTLPAATLSGQYFTHYDVTLDAGWPNITNIILFEKDANGGSATWAFHVDGSLFGSTTTNLNNPFPHSEPPLTSLLIGIATGFPTDASPDQEHVVLMMDSFTASLAANIAWGTLFPTTLEQNLIDTIKLATSGQDWPIIQPALDAAFAFVDGEATRILGLGGFEFDSHFATEGPFTVMAWSDGTTLGTGVGSVTFVPATATPEPGTLGTLLLGFGILAAATLRRKRA